MFVFGHVEKSMIMAHGCTVFGPVKMPFWDSDTRAPQGQKAHFFCESIETPSNQSITHLGPKNLRTQKNTNMNIFCRLFAAEFEAAAAPFVVDTSSLVSPWHLCKRQRDRHLSSEGTTSWWLSWTSHFKKYASVELDHFPKSSGERKKKSLKTSIEIRYLLLDENLVLAKTLGV